MSVANAEASLGAIDIRYTVLAEVGSGVVSGSLHVSMIRMYVICRLRLPSLAEIFFQADYEVYVSGSPLDQTLPGWIAIKTSTYIINAVGQIESLSEVQVGSPVGSLIFYLS